ncbi:hypothetical protein ACFWP5_08765 [Streptomyces sp. NPDC058469]|uniref:hypothetical protein n=1 Tax=Streptomyces sp. NPDC058469 TaxID=3346514 RepID=UPI003654A3C5
MSTSPEIKIVLGAQDNASRAIKGVADSLNALAASAIAQQALSGLKNEFDQTIEASNKIQNSLIGVTSVANAFGANAGVARDAAKSLATDGLMSVDDAATSLKNLLSSGFSMPEAIALVNRFKDTAAFGRQSALGFGQAIEGATEGIKNGNSILSDNAGMTKNLSVILQEAGYSAQDLSKATTDSSIRQALYNGIIRETAPQLGDAARLASTYSGEQSKLSTVIFNTQAKMGDMLKMGLGPLLGGMTQWIQNNQETVISMAGAIGTVVAFGATVLALASIVRFVALVMGGPLMLVLTAISAIVGVVAFNAFNRLQKQMLGTGQQFQTSTGQMKQSADSGLGQAAKKAQDLADKLKEIDENVVKANRDFQQSLADIVKSHDQKIADLTKSVDQEKADFSAAQQDKVDSFKQAQDDMAYQHQQQVDSIQRDLETENLKGRFADQQRIADLRVRLAQENSDYERSTGEKLSQYQKDTTNAQEQHNTKLTDLQTQLGQELAFMQQHSNDLRGVRVADALDEIDKLKQSHNDQLKQYEKQKADVVKNAAQTTAGIANQLNGLPSMVDPNMMHGIGDNIGRDMAHAIGHALIQAWADMVNGVGSAIGQAYIDSMTALAKLVIKASPIGAALKAMKVPGFASGVNSFGGGLALVGERGPELVSLPSGSKVTPAAETRQAMAAGGGTTFNIVNYNYNPVDADQMVRKVQWALRNA